MESVIAVVFSENREKTLFIQRRDVDMWVLPGGGVEPGEAPEQAIIREIEEESGLQAEIIRLVGDYTPVNRLANHTLLYECRATGGSLQTGDETRNLGFFPNSRLPSPCFKLHKHFLDDALSNQKEVIKKKLTQVNYWEVAKFICSSPITAARYICTLAGFPLNVR